MKLHTLKIYTLGYERREIFQLLYLIFLYYLNFYSLHLLHDNKNRKDIMQFPLRFLPHKKIRKKTKQNKIPQFSIMDAYSITGLIQKNVSSRQWNYNLSSLSLIAALPFWHFLKINYIKF